VAPVFAERGLVCNDADMPSVDVTLPPCSPGASQWVGWWMDLRTFTTPFTLDTGVL
jgi:hypothetical protein